MHKKIIITIALVVSAVLLIAIATASANTSLTPQSLSPSEELGKSIYFDQTLSINMNQACADCHWPTVGWTGPDSAINAHGAVYEGSIPGRFGNRKPPSAAYATVSPIFHYYKGLFIGGNFWDGRATGEKLGNPAADQAQGPFLNPKEQGLPDSACVVYRVCTASYSVSFEDVWGTGTCAIAWPGDIETVCIAEGTNVSLSSEDRAKSDQNYDRIALSIAAFEGSSEVNAFTSKFDYSRMGLAKLSIIERYGFSLFQGLGKCAKCHISTGQQPLFTDFTFDNLGIPKNPENPVYDYDPTFIDLGLGGFLETRADYAIYAAENDGKFKVPTLRNVDLRPDPEFIKDFGHNGYFKSLESIVHFYNTRDVLNVCPDAYTEHQALAANCWPGPEVSDNVNKAELGSLGLSPFQEAAIVAFLRTLSDGYIP
jgi:cytochrome c peroxidase